MIVAFEGVDGAGKNTLVHAVEAELIARERPVARIAFPRYEQSVHAQLAQQALHGSMGDLLDSVHGMATMFALDRAEIAAELESLDADGYIVLIDRFIASNAAYSAARLEQQVDGEVVQWVEQLECHTLGIPRPDLQVLVDVDATLAQQRALQREGEDDTRARDAYEKDDDLQARTVAAYRGLATQSWLGPWHRADASDSHTKNLARDITDLIEDMER